MSRPAPVVLMEFTNGRTYRSEQILQADAIWAVFYQQLPFNLKSFNELNGMSAAKYKKTSFSNSGHAYNLAKKLNIMFKTDEFTVFKLTDGEEVAE